MAELDSQQYGILEEVGANRDQDEGTETRTVRGWYSMTLSARTIGGLSAGAFCCGTVWFVFPRLISRSVQAARLASFSSLITSARRLETATTTTAAEAASAHSTLPSL